nr:MAG TPA: hypothetical protein [Caudoviricetes sp.]
MGAAVTIAIIGPLTSMLWLLGEFWCTCQNPSKKAVLLQLIK